MYVKSNEAHYQQRCNVFIYFLQDDIQTIINQQLRTQQQSEQVQRKPASNSMSFWRRPSIASSTRPHRPSSSPASWTSEAGQEKPQSPWRDWLRPGKVAQSGK